MDDPKDAGRVLKWFRQVFGLGAPVDKSDAAVTTDTVHFEFEGYAADWKLGQRDVPGAHLRPFLSLPIDSQIVEQYAEHPKTGVRLSVFTDGSGGLIGRAYFDMGDRTSKQVRVSLGGWENLIARGRPRKQSSLALADEEIYDRIKRRREWYEHGPGGKEYEPTIPDAAEQLAASLELADVADDTEFDLVTQEILKAYDREKKRQGNK